MNEPTSPTTPASPPAVAKNRVSPAKLIKGGIAAVVLLVALGFGVHYWRLSQLYVSTDNAYVNADRIEIAAQVSGPVTRIWIQDQQSVKRGDLLLEIDPQPYRLAVDAAEAQLELSYQSSSQDRAAVEAATATVAQRSAELRNAQSTEQRAMELTKQKPSQSRARRLPPPTRKPRLPWCAPRRRIWNRPPARWARPARKTPRCARRRRSSRRPISISRTRASPRPRTGLIANFEVRPGSMVQSGVPIFTVIGDTEYWVDANFKETEIRRIMKGQKASDRGRHVQGP